MMAFIFVAFLMILANSQSFLLNGRHANKIPFLHAGVGGDINKFEEWEAAKMAAEKAYLTSTSDLDKQFWLLKLTSIQDAIKSESKRKKGDEVTSKRLGRGIKKLLWKQGQLNNTIEPILSLPDKMKFFVAFSRLTKLVRTRRHHHTYTDKAPRSFR